jgi:hypothetical protein
VRLIKALLLGFSKDTRALLFSTVGEAKALLHPKRLLLVCIALSFDAWFPPLWEAKLASSW